MPGQASAVRKYKQTNKKPVSVKTKGRLTRSSKIVKEMYVLYLYKLLKQVHPDLGISSKAISILNSFVNALFEKIAAEAGRLSYYSVRESITSREVQTAVRILFPENMAKEAVLVGASQVDKYKKQTNTTIAL